MNTTTATDNYWITAIAILVAYFVPTIIALIRGHRSRWGILATNVLLGWTVIGWIWAFIWALSNKGNKDVVVMVNQYNHTPEQLRPALDLVASEPQPAIERK